MTDAVTASEATVTPASLWWYARLFSSPAERARLDALTGIRRELAALARPGVEHAVAHIKLQWWTDEIDRLIEGRPVHPLSRMLLDAAGGVSLAPLRQLATATAVTLAQATFESDDELVVFAGQSLGSLTAVLASAAHGDVALAQRVGAGIRLVEALHDWARDAHDGRVLVPLAVLERHGVEVADLHRRDSGPRLQPAFDHVAGLARDALLDATRLPRCLAVLAALHLAALDAQQQRGYVPWPIDQSVGPLRRLWLAWRTASRHPEPA